MTIIEMAQATLSLDREFAAMAARVENLDIEVDPQKPETLLHARSELASIILDLQKLFEGKIEFTTKINQHENL